MSITRVTTFGTRETIEAGDVECWCKQCRFPLTGTGKKCKTQPLIQQCWDMMLTGHQWHLEHECPFAHQGKECRCNDYKNIQDAFVGAGIVKK